jgi:hypothetical protein
LFTSLHQTIGQNHNATTTTQFTENVANIKYLKMMLTNQNFIHEKIKARQFGECLLSCSAKSFVIKHAIKVYTKFKIHETTILPIFYPGEKLGLSH